MSYGAVVIRTIGVDSGTAVESGTLADGSRADVKLIGHDRVTDNYIAGKVEVESMGMMTED